METPQQNLKWNWRRKKHNHADLLFSYRTINLKVYSWFPAPQLFPVVCGKNIKNNINIVEYQLRARYEIKADIGCSAITRT